MNSTRNSEVNSAATGDAGEQIVVNVMGRREATVRRWPDGTLTLVDPNFKKWMRGIHEHEPNETPSSEQHLPKTRTSGTSLTIGKGVVDAIGVESHALPDGQGVPPNRVPKTRHGLTLLELVVVLLITVALAGVVVPLVSDHVSDASEDATRVTLAAVRDAVTRYWQDSGTLKLVPTVHDLFQQPMEMPNYDPRYKIGWNGPYLLQATGGTSDNLAVLDAWGRPVVIQALAPVDGVRDLRVVSAGPNAQIDISDDPMNPDTNAELLDNPTLAGDDVYVTFTLR